MCGSDDKSNDVQSVAVKCLAILLKKVQHAQVGEIADKLSGLILDGKDTNLRDVRVKFAKYCVLHSLRVLDI